MSDLLLPDDLRGRLLEELRLDELITILEANTEGKISVNFSGKAVARRLSRQVRPRITRSVPRLSAGSPEGQARNLLIEGDNLQTMVTLFKERGRVDLIVADPPYNTGNDFRYNDKWEDDPNDDGLGEFIDGNDAARHTKWMRFMYPRLKMMRSMLKRSGVLAICIDYRELFHLGQMLDELFGEQNRLAIINWQKITSPKNHDHGVSSATEYVLVYARDEASAATGKLSHSLLTAAGYRNPDKDELGSWSPSDSTLMGASTHAGQVYGIQNPFTGKLHYPQAGRCWRNERSKMKAAVEEWGIKYEDRELDDGLRPALLIKGACNPLTEDYATDPVVLRAQKAVVKRRAKVWPRFFWRDDRRGNAGHGELRYKTYSSDVAAGVVPTTFWAADDFEPLGLGGVSWTHQQSGTSEIGVRELNQVVGRGHGFDTVKPLSLIRKIVSIWCPPEGLVLDPFAGSGTTGHAVLDLNEETGANRRFILIEQGRPENGDPYAQSLTCERLRRVVTGDYAAGKRDPVDSGFKFLRLGKKIDAEALLLMERDEMTDTVIASHFDMNRKRGAQLITYPSGTYRYLVARNNDGEGFYLVWGGADGETNFTDETYDVVAQEAQSAGLKSVYHVYARLYLYAAETVRFYQIPDRILSDFGLDLKSEPFSNEDDE